MPDNMLNHPGLIIGFAAIIAVMLALDLGVFNKKAHSISNKEAVLWSVTWVSLAMIFSMAIYFAFGRGAYGLEKFSQFQSAYWIEKALSVDNIFVFVLVFGFFGVPAESRHKVLYWGVLGAIAMRAVFIFTGIELINRTYLPEIALFGRTISVNVVLTIFGIFLICAGIKSGFGDKKGEKEKDFSNNPGVRLVNKLFKVSKNYDGNKFFTRENGIKIATPLLVVVGVIEFTDLIFAVDSIPAVFAVSDDPFILYTSNIFAILGLRALYFLLANFIHKFHFLKYGLAFILTYIGIKMIINPLIHIPSYLSLCVVGGVLILSVVISLIYPPNVENHKS